MARFLLRGGLFVFAFSFFAAVSLFSGPDSTVYDWQDIRQVKGGFTQCKITEDGDDSGMSPDTTAYFDKDGRLVKFQVGAGVKLFTYDASGRFIEIRDGSVDENDKFNLDTKTVYTYGGKGIGELTKISLLDPKGELIYEEKVTSAGGNLKVERLTPEGSVYGADTYDKNFKLIESFRYTTDSVAMGQKEKQIESVTKISYDKNGNMSEKIVEFVTPPYEMTAKKYTQKFTYKVDANGNKTAESSVITPDEKNGIWFSLNRPAYKVVYSTGTSDTAIKKDNSSATQVVGKKVQVLWNGQWFAAEIREQKGDQYFIHYTDYDDRWDEWVTTDRIKF
jgi:hypothetical protein